MHNLKVLLVVMVILMASLPVFAGLPDGSVDYGKTRFFMKDTVAVISLSSICGYIYSDESGGDMLQKERFTIGNVDYGVVTMLSFNGAVRVDFTLKNYPPSPELAKVLKGKTWLLFKICEPSQRVVFY